MGTGYIGMVFLLLAARRASCSCYPILKEGREVRPPGKCSRSKCDSEVGVSNAACYYSGSTCYYILHADVLERVYKACVYVRPPPPPGVLLCPGVVSDTFAYLEIECIDGPVYDPCKKFNATVTAFTLTHVWNTSNTDNKCVCEIQAREPQTISLRGMNLYYGDKYEEGRSIEIKLKGNGRLHTIVIEESRRQYPSWDRDYDNVDTAWFNFKGQKPARQLMHVTSSSSKQFYLICPKPPYGFSPFENSGTEQGSGNNDNQGSGKNGNEGSGNNGNQGSGKNGNEGSGKNGNQGSGKNGDEGSGNNGNQGSGKNDEEGSGNNGNQGSGKNGDDGSRDKADSRKKETTTKDSATSSTQRGKGRFFSGSDEYEENHSGIYLSKTTIMALAIILAIVVALLILLAFAVCLHHKRKKREMEGQEVTSGAVSTVSQQESTVQSQADTDFSQATSTGTASVTENTSTAGGFSRAPPTKVTGPKKPRAQLHRHIPK